MIQKILDLLEQENYFELNKEFAAMNTADIAQIFEEIEEKNILVAFRILPKEIAADVFSHMSLEHQKTIVESITDTEIKTIIDKLFLDDTIDFLEEMPANIVKRVLATTNVTTRKLINQFLSYPDDSVGSIMTIEYVDLKKEMTVKEALQHIRKTGIKKETIDICYVTSSNRVLEGTLSIRKLILSDDDVIISDIMDTDVLFLQTHDEQEVAVTFFKKYDFFVMPVVDSEKRLVGIVTVDDILDVVDQQNTEDFQRMAAMQPSEKEYLKTSAFVLAKHRIPWLLILMLSATFTGAIISRFDNALQSVIVLAAFIPLLMDSGGNAGSQSSTLVIRGLALGEIQIKDIFKVIWMELKVSFIVGLVLVAVNFVRIYFFTKADFLVALTVSITLFFTIVLAKIVGGLLPIIAKKCKIDPAIMASPLITTIVDAFALIIYFSIATKLLGI